MKETLYSINEKLKEIIEIAEQEAINADGEISEATALAIDKAELSRVEKAEAVIAIIKNNEAQALAHKNEANKQKALQKTCEATVKRLKKYLLDCECSNIETVFGKTYERRSEAVEIVDPFFDIETVDARFVRNKPELNKTACKEALLNGEKIDGIEIVENVTVVVK